MKPKDKGDAFDHARVTVIEPLCRWQWINFKEIWGYRELLLVFTERDIKVRYKQTVLGALWAIIRPLATMLIFTIIFGRLAKMPSDGYPYAIFVYAGLLPWTFFSTAVTSASNSLVGSAHLVSKVYFPRLIIPISTIGSGLVDLVISTCILLLLMVYFQVGLTINILFAPILLLGVIFTALGFGIALSALTVAYRDFIHIVPFVVQFWMYLTPVIFPVSIVPEDWQWLLFLNPMSGIIEGFRSAFLGKPFDIFSIGISIFVATLICMIGIMYFEKVEKRFADII